MLDKFFNMTILDQLSSTLKIAGSVGINVLKTTSWPLPLSAAKINDALSRALPAGPVQNLSIAVHDDYFSLVAMIKLKSGLYCVTTSFNIIRASCANHEQKLVLRRSSPLLILGTTWRSRAVVAIYRTLQILFPIYDPLKAAARRAPGIYVNGETWTVDLKELGFQDALENLLAERISTVFPAARVLASAAATLTLAHITVEKAEIKNGNLNVYVQYID